MSVSGQERCRWFNSNAGLDARRNGLTPFSVYQGRWNAAFRDMESEIIPMCEDQGMAIVSWASLGGGQLVAAEQREKSGKDPNAGKGFYSASEDDIKVCDVLERLAETKNVTLQDMVSSFCNAKLACRCGAAFPETIANMCRRLWRTFFINQPTSSQLWECKLSST